MVSFQKKKKKIKIKQKKKCKYNIFYNIYDDFDVVEFLN